MITNSKSSYLDPTYPAYYWHFNRPKTILCLSLRRFILIITTYDIIFSSFGVSSGLMYLLIDQLSHIFQSNEFIQKLTYLPIGMFFDNRIIFKSMWIINRISDDLYTIIYLYLILNSSLLLSAINMLTAIKYYKPHRAMIYFVIKTAYFISTITIFVEWLVNPKEHHDSIRDFYGNGNLGFFQPNLNIFCLALFDCIFKIFTIVMIFRSIQYLRDYCLHKESNLIKNLPNEYSPSTTHQFVIHIMPNDTILNKQYNI